MNREIKFRCRLKSGNGWHYFEFPMREFAMGFEFYDMNSWTQFTSLKDKNCKEIFEGDIMEDKTKPSMTKVWVVWNEAEARWALEDNRVNGEYSLTYSKWEIIGNIYDNPELIKP